MAQFVNEEDDQVAPCCGLPQSAIDVFAAKVAFVRAFDAGLLVEQFLERPGFSGGPSTPDLS
jgi:hypothetical protein